MKRPEIYYMDISNARCVSSHGDTDREDELYVRPSKLLQS